MTGISLRQIHITNEDSAGRVVSVGDLEPGRGLWWNVLGKALFLAQYWFVSPGIMNKYTFAMI